MGEMSKIRELPVFFDPDRKRWPRLRQGVFLTGLFISILFGVLIFSVLLNPILPTLKLPPSSILRNGGHVAAPFQDPILTPRQRALKEAKQKLEKERKLRQASFAQAALPVSASSAPLAVGFYVNWDEASLSSLQENLENPDVKLDVVIGEFLHLDDASGKLKEDNPERESVASDFIRTHRPATRIMALVNNFNGTDWEGDKLKGMLADPGARARAIQGLLDYVQGHGFAGVSIDFESIPDESQQQMLQFINDLGIAFHPAGLFVSMNVPANNDSFDYARLSAAVDYLILMVYDQHWAKGLPGPISAIDWFTDVLKARQADVPPQNTIVAIANYAYDWVGNKEPAAKTFEEAVLTASESSTDDDKVNIHLDPDSLNPTFDYEENTGEVHHVWMLDAVTAFDQISAAKPFMPRGFALWRLGSEDPTIWKFFGQNVPLDGATASTLSEMRYGYDLDYEGRGEILRITSTPKQGSRQVPFDSARGMITGETFISFPSPYVITRYGAADHKLALTFDDGPDPEITPQILDVLKREHAPATFFDIGLNAEEHPELLKREIAEGHEVGNHTFTHPNIADISATQLNLELKATQTLFESVIGRRSLLFRPPYAEDSEPDTTGEVRPLELVTAQNYLTVGMQIDPADWKRPGVDKIVSEAIAQAERTEVVDKATVSKGNVILLHDSGGDRSETIKALPIIIEQLRNRGFEFVTVSELMGKSRDDVMPPISARDQLFARINRTAFSVVNFGVSLIDWLFLIGIALGIGRLLFIGSLAVIERWRGRHAKYDPAYAPTVAVVIPAYNEEKVVVQTITSLLASDHPPNFEIVVVDDGSSDDTYATVRDSFADEPRVRVFTKPNGGKPTALNFGVSHTQAEIVIALDADTIFARDTISKLVRHFADSKIGAVAGNAKVGNRINLLTRWQALEYITSQNLDRRAFEVLNCITVVPGAVGAWRRDLILRAGGFTPLTLAEDADLTMMIRRLGYSIAYEEEAIGLTEAPDTIGAFIKQRFRWMYGTLQAAWKHSDALFRPKYGSLGLIALPNIFIFQVFFPLVSPIMDLLMLGTVAVTGFNRWQHPAEFSADTMWRVLFYYAMFMAVEFMAAVLAFLLEPKENRRLLVWLFWQRFFYRQLMYYVAIKSTLASLRGISVGWGKQERKATVKV
jgi:cellulose synthase/poly-beta-1,6-N-acetylglucosamine synthase-like glycosyltransferase/peptidoglycan/xylan/chitin deacetylase (PgdA/CDA1 family)/spore germination protein YaaH